MGKKEWKKVPCFYIIVPFAYSFGKKEIPVPWNQNQEEKNKPL